MKIEFGQIWTNLDKFCPNHQFEDFDLFVSIDATTWLIVILRSFESDWFFVPLTGKSVGLSGQVAAWSCTKVISIIFRLRFLNQQDLTDSTNKPHAPSHFLYRVSAEWRYVESRCPDLDTLHQIRSLPSCTPHKDKKCLYRAARFCESGWDWNRQDMNSIEDDSAIETVVTTSILQLRP